MGECGKRGGYVECANIGDDVVDQLYKMNSVGLCPNVVGQLVVRSLVDVFPACVFAFSNLILLSKKVDLMVRPPASGEPSHKQYVSETKAIFDSLKRRCGQTAYVSTTNVWR